MLFSLYTVYKYKVTEIIDSYSTIQHIAYFRAGIKAIAISFNTSRFVSSPDSCSARDGNWLKI